MITAIAMISAATGSVPEVDPAIADTEVYRGPGQVDPIAAA